MKYVRVASVYIVKNAFCKKDAPSCTKLLCNLFY